MEAKELLTRAVQCDQADRILEAQKLYYNGIQKLMELITDDMDRSYKRQYYERLHEYIERVINVNRRVEKLLDLGKIVANIQIHENSQRHSYETLFGKYFTAEVREIYIEEPYLHQMYQVGNLVIFLELAVKKCPNLKYIKLLTNRVYLKNLSEITNDLKSRGIELDIALDRYLHDRKIALSCGYVIKIGRGLHIFKAADSEYSLGIFDYDFRKCLKTDVDIWRSSKT